MKVLIISDTHGRHENLIRVLREEEPVDMLIHCGDTEGGEDWIRQHTMCMSVPIVKGNNDFFSNLPGELELDICARHVFITHGHHYGVSMGTERLEEEARYRKTDIVMFGHIHRPVLAHSDGLWIINPGSLSYPRQEGHRPTYMIMHIEDGKEPVFEKKEL
ncbi:MAG: metallophosphoesterase [Lachnospiraceae bacterium]|nr:metallophosphoesterase [Lachnospiraceae bacterium]